MHLSRILLKGSHEFTEWLKRLFTNPVFLFVTLWGHIAIFAGACSFYQFEGAAARADGPGFFDCYYWAISLATTTGTSDFNPATVGGKLTAVFVMVSGSLFLWSYAALFAASIVAPAMKKVGREVERLEQDVEEVEREVQIDVRVMEKLLKELEIYNRREGKS